MTTPDLLPSRVMLDAGVLMRAIGQQSQDPRSEHCRRLYDALVGARRKILIAAPALAEVLRGQDTSPIFDPLVQVVPFDGLAARILAKNMPHVLFSTLQEPRPPKVYLKFDSLIVACALRGKADVLVSLDGDMSGLATKAGLRVVDPPSLLGPQKAFAFPAPARS